MPTWREVRNFASQKFHLTPSAVSSKFSDFAPCAHPQSNILHVITLRKTMIAAYVIAKCVGLGLENKTEV